MDASEPSDEHATLGRLGDSRAQRTHDALVDLAGELFATQGYAQTSMRDLASRSPVTLAAIYLHFKNKAELLVEALHRHIERDLENSPATGRGTANPVDRLTEVARQFPERQHLRSLLVQAAAASQADDDARHRIRSAQQSHVQGWIDRYRANRSAIGLDDAVDIDNAVLCTWAIELGLAMLEAFDMAPASPDAWAEVQHRVAQSLFPTTPGRATPVPTVDTASIPRHEHGADPRYQSLMEATRTAARQGYDAVSMRDLAETCKISMTTIYQFCRSKDHLIAEAHREGMESLRRQMAVRTPKGQTATKRVSWVMKSFAKALEVDPILTRTLMRAMYSLDPEVGPARASVSSTFQSMIEFAVADESIQDRDAAIATLGHVVDSAIVGWLSERHDTQWVRDQLETAVQLLIRPTAEAS